MDLKSPLYDQRHRTVGRSVGTPGTPGERHCAKHALVLQHADVECDVQARKLKHRNEAIYYNVGWVFEILHKKEDRAGDNEMAQRIQSVMMEGQKKAPLMIPDTVVYRHGYPSAWYFTSVVDGTIKRKRNENLNPNKILESFEDLDDPYRVVAFFVNTTWDTKVCPTNNITFMDSRELHRFILSQNPMSEGFLQKHIPFKEVKHGHKPSDTTLHCSWSPHCCFVEQRTNLMRSSTGIPGIR